jgi:hypothetical protein
MHCLFFTEIFENVEHLEKLKLNCNDLTTTSMLSLINILHNNEKIKHFSISGSLFYQLMSLRVITTFSFKLECLSVSHKNFIYNVSYEKLYDNLSKLIDSQSSHLKAVSFGDWMDEKVLKTVFRLPKLTELSLKGFKDLDYNENIVLNKNSLTKMRISIISDDSLFEKIIMSAPFLTELNISSMSSRFLEICDQVVKNLRTLIIFYFNVTDIEDKKEYFKNLQHLTIYNNREGLLENLEEKNVAEMTEFQKKVLVEISKTGLRRRKH